MIIVPIKIFMHGYYLNAYTGGSQLGHIHQNGVQTSEIHYHA